MAEPEEEIVKQQVKISVFTPIIYVVILLSIFYTFTVYYRRNRVKNLAEAEPIFPENYNASIYQFLKQQYLSDAPKEQKPHEKVMKAALLRRAVEAIRRSMKLKENEPIFNKLYQEGLIGDDIFKQFELLTKFQELELNDIIQETQRYKKDWVKTFFPVAQEICFNEALRRRLYAMDVRSVDLTNLWELAAKNAETPAESSAQSVEAAKGKKIATEAKIEELTKTESDLDSSKASSESNKNTTQ